ncbi:hypothetical protein G6O67_001676 [Ophiocordyceps sinensis]|uniref:Uncharacterized protein n=1 Tax=Ophiocordyceps sinensis TaxID=72228 RepID=A0A8H4V9G5_9HYPO|nr:hypothetical protein G6O67_001676 [Ophiocordyceps sinensis]
MVAPYAKTAKPATANSAWVSQVEAGALLGNAFLKHYRGSLDYDKEVVRVGVLDGFEIPFDICKQSNEVVPCVKAVRKTIVPPGATIMVPAAWKELPRDRAYTFFASHSNAVHSIVDSKSLPAVLVTNSTDNKDANCWADVRHAESELGEIRHVRILFVPITDTI